MMKNPVLSIMIILILLLISRSNKVYAYCDESVTSLEMGYSRLNNDKKTDADAVRYYRVDTINGIKTITLYDINLGEEQTAEIEFLKSLPKKSLHLYRAMCGSDTVSLLDLNPEVGESFVVGETSIVKVRPIRSLRVLYWELPSASRAYCFENDTIWFSRDDKSPKYLLMDDGVVIKRAQKQIIDGVEVWKYDDGNEIKAMKINWSHNHDSLSVGQNGNLSLYNNLQFENGVCYKTLNVSFLSFGKNPLNGQFSKGLSQIFKKKNDIPTSSISFIYDGHEYYISLCNDCQRHISIEDFSSGDIITLKIAFFQDVKQPYDYVFPFAMVTEIGTK